jgi:AsmA protein
MKFPIKRTAVKTLKISGIVLCSIVLLMFLLPYLFPQTFTNKIKSWANNSINGNIEFSGTGLSFFKHFPALTLTLYDVNLKGSAPFETDTLIAAKELSLGIDLSSLLKSKININKIYLANAFINIQVDKLGKANYNIYKSTPQKSNAKADTSQASLGIEQILVEKSRLVYNDESIPMKINALGFNYLGSGDLSKDIFDLHSHTEIQSLDFIYAKQPYIVSKKVNADLVTQINTKSLAFIFQKNDLMINRLPVQFIGKFAFLKDGYDMDFKIDSHQSDLGDIVTALPASYQKMFNNTEIDGIGNVKISLTGKYIAKDNIKPNLNMSLKIRKGRIANNKTPSPISNLYLDFETRLPGLNVDSLYVSIDSSYFNIGKDYFSSVMRVKGVKEPEIYAKVNMEMDLEKWSNALGIKPISIKGNYALHLLAQGKYATGIKYTGIRNKIDTVITSIPKFTVQSSFKDGYFKYASLPQSVNNISFNLRADCPDNNYKHISMALDNVNATALNNYIKGYFKLGNTANFPIDAAINAKLHLADLQQIYPLDSAGITLQGDLNALLKAKGSYLPAKKIFPAITANINLQNASIKTKYYPHPIQKIQIDTRITNNSGSLDGLKVLIKPISFEFEGEPFTIKAKLSNFNNLEYNIAAQGVINLGKIYQVFAIKGYNVAGSIAANLSLKGKQSDAVAGRYDQLANSGTFKVNNISLTSDLFPKPFIINKGVFSFNQDKMQFDTFVANYGTSQIVLNGALSNVIDYAIKPDAVLSGNFNLQSDQLIVDDFMAFASSSSSAQPVQHKAAAPSGVIIVPHNLNLNFTADVKKVKYNGLTINNSKGQMLINNGTITLKQTGFNLIGAPVNMDADYTSLSPLKAVFNYHISAKDFDIKKAYDKIKLFHDMATAAANAEGLVSLDYKLGGQLNSNMMPVYSSLAGGGTLSAKQLKMHGFKLLNAVGSETKHDSLTNNPGVSQIEIKTTIAHNIITIAQSKIRVAGFRVRFGGQVSFDKAINLNFRLGLPPLGIIGIPMTITGTQDNPKIHLGKGKKEDELPETADDKP